MNHKTGHFVPGRFVVKQIIKCPNERDSLHEVTLSVSRPNENINGFLPWKLKSPLSFSECLWRAPFNLSTDHVFFALNKSGFDSDLILSDHSLAVRHRRDIICKDWTASIHSLGDFKTAECEFPLNRSKHEGPFNFSNVKPGEKSHLFRWVYSASVALLTAT